MANEDTKQIRVLIADDHFLVRMGLSALIDSQPDMIVVAEAANGQQAIDMFRQERPDVTLMDLRMPVINGLEATKAIIKEAPEARLIVLTTYDGDEDIYRSLQAGARSYLLKNGQAEELLTTIRVVHAGRRHLSAAVATRLAERIPLSDLTARELEVLKLIVKGMNNSQIAGALKILQGTVKIHINNIFGKLGVSDRTQAATKALQRGIVHPDED